jgi:hypothetical protein
MLRIFTPEKIRRLRPGLNPRSWVPEASMLTARTPKPLRHMQSKAGPVATQSKALVYGRSPAAIVGVNPTGGMVCCVVCLLSHRGLYDEPITHPRGVLPTVARPCVCVIKKPCVKWQPRKNRQSHWAMPVAKINVAT